MPKPTTFPTLYDNVLQLNICELRKDGCIKPGQTYSGTISWSRDGNTSASIGITVNMRHAAPYIELSYLYNSESRKYQVRLVSVPSNLGAGELWHFLCPHTGKRCRILYSVGGWFLHRDAFNGVYYDSQVQSHKTRNYMRVVGPLFKTDKLREELCKPYFKRRYAGLPTRRYAHIQKKLAQADQVSALDYEKALAGIL